MQQFEPSNDRAQFAWTILRFLLAILIGIHGWYRIFKGEAGSIDASLAPHLAFGAPLAILITYLEAGAAVLLIFNRLVLPLSLTFAGLYLSAIISYHAQHGWFTSGADEDGMEYALMLSILFLCLAWQAAPLKLFPLGEVATKV